MLLILSCQVSETRHVKSGRYCARSGLSVPIFRQVKVGSASSGVVAVIGVGPVDQNRKIAVLFQIAALAKI